MSGELQPLDDLDELGVPDVPALSSETTESPGNFEDANKEASAIARGTLEDEAAKKEHSRNEDLRDAIHKWALRLILLAAVVFAITIVILAWHFLAPEKWAWLDREQLATIKTIVFSGALSSAAGGYLSRRVH